MVLARFRCRRRSTSGWTRELAEGMRPFTTGSDYVNQIGLETDKGSERIKAPFVRDWADKGPPIIGRRCKPLTGG